jgi:large subunit ribosomal protein L29
MKTVKELKEMTGDELQQQLDDVKQELFKLQVQQVSGQLENPLQIRTLRRQIARIKTIMNETASAEG